MQLKVLFISLFMADTLFRFEISSLHGFSNTCHSAANDNTTPPWRIGGWRCPVKKAFTYEIWKKCNARIFRNNTYQFPHCEPKSMRRLAPGVLQERSTFLRSCESYRHMMFGTFSSPPCCVMCWFYFLFGLGLITSPIFFYKQQILLVYIQKNNPPTGKIFYMLL
jgi:hypothetical protein